jgi:streptomycin 6-kinase
LLNCYERLWSERTDMIRRFADLLGVDSERVRLWVFARAAAEPRQDWMEDRLTQLARALAP